MDDFNKGNAKLKKAEGKYSGKDIYEEEIYRETAIIGGRTMKLNRLPPIKPYLDPLAYFNEVAEIKKKALANDMNTKKGDVISDSPQEISIDAWNEGQSDYDSPQEILDDA